MPLIRNGTQPTQMLFMKPCREAKHLGAPAFQIAKGTRRINVSGSWCDMREDDLRFADASFHEALLATALREGREEIGLLPENISRLYDMGEFTFISASRGHPKPIHMFAAEVIDKQNFCAFESTTSEIAWLSYEQFLAAGRADHQPIVREILIRLGKGLASA